MSRIVSLLGGLSLIGLLFLGARPARAITVTVQECTVATFPCPAASTTAGGVRSDGVGPLGANAVDAMPFNFGNAQVSFTGTVAVTDIGGTFDSLLASGTATENATAVTDYLDVDISQTYVTDPSIVGDIGAAYEFMNGTCNAAATAAGSYVAGRLHADGTLLPVMGGPGDCGAFTYVGGSFVLITQPVQFDALAQFVFNASAAVQTIDLPLGEDADAPEPASLLLLGLGLAGLASCAIAAKTSVTLASRVS